MSANHEEGRREDFRFVRGRGRYIGDFDRAGVLHLAFVRSPHAHALIAGIDITEAMTSDGVVAVFTARALEADGVKPIPGGFPARRADGRPPVDTPRPALAGGRVRYVGEAVAMVIAESREQAIAASELVAVDYDALPAVADFPAPAHDGAVVWDDAPDNRGFLWKGGDAAATEAGLKAAARVVRRGFTVSRVSANPMEPRANLAEIGADGRLILHLSQQSPHAVLGVLVQCGFDREKTSIRIPDVGGSFGLKLGINVEDVAIAFAARKLGRPVLWEATRSESFVADNHGRGAFAEAEIGFDTDGIITGLRVRALANLGAYLNSKSIWAIGNLGGLAGVYRIPAMDVEMQGCFTNTGQTGAYRGAGRPEATFVIESLLDEAARELGMSPYELRRRNLIPAADMPYQTALTFKYDCGEFERNMEMAAELADLAGFPARLAESAARGKLRGLGLANCIETAGGPLPTPSPDMSRMTLLPDGRLRLQTGSVSVGQGLETAFPALIAGRLGIASDQVVYQQGNTDNLPIGKGNGGSAAMVTGGSAVLGASNALIEKLTSLAAPLLESAPEDVFFADGIFGRRDGNKTLTLKELAAELSLESDGVVASAEFTYLPTAVTFPNATHVCEVEIDPETGMVGVLSYCGVEDIGRVLNPMLANGQLHGGIVQGIGQALGEEIVYDAEGQLLTGSFMDYQMPRAAEVPSFRLAHNEVPTEVNPLGAKGVGEAGTVGALAATMNAVNDALARAGAGRVEMPATPSRVWRVLAGKG